MDKKYQIFISSTFEDLKEERDQAIKAVLEMEHIPVGMEMFSAADEEQWSLIARKIEETDYYVLIVGHRYGSETDEGISFTEKEYDYAVALGIPILGFIIDDSTPWPLIHVDKSPITVKKLESFKSKVKKKLVYFWKSKEDLHGKVSISLIKAMNANPRVGWVKANKADGVEIFSTRDEWLKKTIELESCSSLIGTLHYSDQPRVLGGRSDEYFEKSNELIGSRSKEVVYRRIASVSTKEKAQWVLSSISEMSHCDNFSISIIDVDHTNIPLVCLHVGCIEGKYYNFVFSTVDPSGTISAYLIKSDLAGRKSYETFNSVWSKSVKLKEGNRIYWDNVQDLSKRFGLENTEEYKLVMRLNSEAFT